MSSLWHHCRNLTGTGQPTRPIYEEPKCNNTGKRATAGSACCLSCAAVPGTGLQAETGSNLDSEGTQEPEPNIQGTRDQHMWFLGTSLHSNRTHAHQV